MFIERKNGILILAIYVVILFGLNWYWISASTSPWSDEPRHLIAAENLAISGEPILYEFSNHVATKIQYYKRGNVITYPLAFLYKHGMEGLIWARSIPLFFVVLTLLFWIIYFYYRQRINGVGIALLVIFFLGQGFMLEQATYIRMYAPLGFVFSVILVCLWELKKALELKRRLMSIAFSALCLEGIWIAIADRWQGEHVILFLLAALLLNSYIWKKTLFFISKPVYIFMIFIALVCLAPCISRLLDQSLPVIGALLKIRTIHTSYHNWDNIIGLSRFLLSINVMLIGLVWISLRSDQNTFFRWLYLSGLLGGVLLGLFTPLSFIYFSRYFYLSVIAVTVGFVGIYQDNAKGPFKTVIMILYLMISFVFTSINIHFERSNMPIAINWLMRNMGEHDVLLYYNRFYTDNEFIGRNVYLIKDANIDKVIEFVSLSGVKNVYLLTVDNYKSRDIFYKKTTGHFRHSIWNSIASYLTYRVSGEEVIYGLWGCDLKKFKPDRVLLALKFERDKLRKKHHTRSQ